MSLQSARVHHFVGWYSHSLMSDTDIHSHGVALLNTHLLHQLSLSMPPAPGTGGCIDGKDIVIPDGDPTGVETQLYHRGL